MTDSLQTQNDLHLESVLGDGVEFIGLLNKHGRLVESQYNKQIQISMRKSEMLFMVISLSSSLQRDFDDDFGAVKYTVIERRNLKFVSLPREDGTIVILMKKKFDHKPVIRKMTEKKVLAGMTCVP